MASARFLKNETAVKNYLNSFKQAIDDRLQAFYKGFSALKAAGHQVDAIAPQAAIYLTVKIDLVGKTTADGHVLQTNKDVAAYLLKKASLALVPFNAFGTTDDLPVSTIRVGTRTSGQRNSCYRKVKRSNSLA